MLKFKSLLFMIILAFFNLGHAWGPTPHMLVAEVAYQHLNDDVRNKVNYLISLHEQEYPLSTDFVSTGPWADDLKQAGDHRYDNWHYITLMFSDYSPMPRREEFPAPKHVVWAIEQDTAALKNPKTPDKEKALALRRLIHWVGDLHQPMHATTYVSYHFPMGDKGGNGFGLSKDAPAPNLHALWDYGVGNPLWATTMNRPLSRDDQEQLTEMGIALEQKYRLNVGSMDPVKWALESHELGRRYAYKDLRIGGKPSPQYLVQGQMICEQRVLLAGLRLAALLNQSL